MINCGSYDVLYAYIINYLQVLFKCYLNENIELQVIYQAFATSTTAGKKRLVGRPRNRCPYILLEPTRLCPDTFVPTHVCAQTRLCPHMFVPRLVCAHTRLCPDTFVPWHVIIVWSQSCLGTNACGNSHVVTVVWAQSCMGTNVVEPWLDGVRAATTDNSVYLLQAVWLESEKLLFRHDRF